MDDLRSAFDGFTAIIPAGGAGTRLWPLSRQDRPKFLLDLLGSGRSLLQATVDRMDGLCAPDRIFVVTGGAHAPAVRAQVPSVAHNVLVESAPRDSMAAIGLAAAVVHHRHGPTVVGSFAADHVIRGLDEFHETVRQAIEAAHHGYLVTIGIPATRPSTAFGYVRSGEKLSDQPGSRARHVEAFKEKPDAETAMQYLATGKYRWNAGMFVVRTDVLLGHLQRIKPEMHDILTQLATVWDTDGRDEAMSRLWPQLEKVPIDVAIAEPVAAEGKAAIVLAGFGWDDVGDFNSLAALLPSVDRAGNKALGNSSLIVRDGVAGSIVSASAGRVVAVLGLDDVVVIDTPDAVLVTTRARAQAVKDIVTMVAADVPDAPV
ncbi:mannose-1-phosphate guanylyltransferase [Rarobacter incanus]|nr:mannose-1-phosphate guanylyltransferase [Rarobacter incanus]